MDHTIHQLDLMLLLEVITHQKVVYPPAAIVRSHPLALIPEGELDFVRVQEPEGVNEATIQ